MAISTTKRQMIGGVPIQNTSNLINENTRICMLVYAPAKFGKTTFAATLDTLTRNVLGKPSLFIAVEVGEGGGTLSIQDLGIDYVQPRRYEDVSSILAHLQDDTYYGGVILDSATELVNLHVKPRVLREPAYDANPSRALGVPSRSDYQTMGELVRQVFASLIRMTTHENIDKRKHVITTALLKDKFDDNGILLRTGPDLPGQLQDTATAMFHTVATIRIVDDVIPDPRDPKKPTRVQRRLLQTLPEGKKVLGDRTGCFPNGCELDLPKIWEQYWLPRIQQRGGHDARKAQEGAHPEGQADGQVG